MNQYVMIGITGIAGIIPFLLITSFISTLLGALNSNVVKKNIRVLTLSLMGIALVIFFISLNMSWGIKRFWIFSWGELNIGRLLNQNFIMYIFLFLGWYCPVFLITWNKVSNSILLRLYGVYNLCIPFIVTIYLHYFRHTFATAGPLLYLLSALLLYMSIELFIYGIGESKVDDFTTASEVPKRIDKVGIKNCKNTGKSNCINETKFSETTPKITRMFHVLFWGIGLIIGSALGVGYGEKWVVIGAIMGFIISRLTFTEAFEPNREFGKWASVCMMIFGPLIFAFLGGLFGVSGWYFGAWFGVLGYFCLSVGSYFKEIKNE